MTQPTATYRLQFRNGMTFEKATALIPHWRELGISHVYASPIFAATEGSTHGYDVTDPNVIDPTIGGREGFESFSRALSDAGLQLILDIVPNHLAASLENPWWRSVVELGQDSPFATHFDIDWSRKLTLPVLDKPLDVEIAASNIRLVIEQDNASLAIDYMGTLYPLHPDTYRDVLAGLDSPFPGQPVLLSDDTILAMQPWQFIEWREAPNGLSYRRFFEITGLVGVRVEIPEVFDAVHATVLELVRSDKVAGLRVDHIDGLADPEAYLRRLRQEIGPDVYLVVEKILERDEILPPDWPVDGTTGYEFIAAVADVMVQVETPALDRAYAEVSPDHDDAHAALVSAKRLMVDRNFRGEVLALQRLAGEIAASEGAGLDPQYLDTAMRDVLVAFPVYRTYGSERGMSASDEAVLKGVFDSLDQEHGDSGRAERRFLRAVLQADVGPASRDDAIRLRTRMQHLTGPLLAKALEDTFFFRYNRLIGLNEVGGDPLARDGTVARFHVKMEERLRTQPHGLTATSTHDTKRGEDARTRLYAISEAGDIWVEAVARWRQMHAHLVRALDDGPAPEPNLEWMLYQALAGAWPPGMNIADADAVAALRERFVAFTEKAIREAKLRTNWGDGNETYEGAVKQYVEAMLSVDDPAFLADFAATLEPLIRTGFHYSMTQTLLKLTVPGIPDIYQGCEGFDFSLVDPDNRRPPDFAALADTPLAAQKRDLIRVVLDLRRRQPALFSEGTYIPLSVEGDLQDHLIAFMRVHDGGAVVVVVPRLMFGQVRDDAVRTPSLWSGTRIPLPAPWTRTELHDVLNGRVVSVDHTLSVDAAFAYQPFAILTAGANAMTSL